MKHFINQMPPVKVWNRTSMRRLFYQMELKLLKIWCRLKLSIAVIIKVHFKNNFFSSKYFIKYIKIIGFNELSAKTRSYRKNWKHEKWCSEFFKNYNSFEWWVLKIYLKRCSVSLKSGKQINWNFTCSQVHW